MTVTSAPNDYASLFHALRATNTTKAVSRVFPLLFTPPGTVATPWLCWCLGGTPLPPRTLDRAPRLRYESRDPVPQPVPTNGTGSAKMWQPHTPAMAGGLTDRVWTLRKER